MAYTAKVFGVATFSGATGFTAAILGTFDLSCDSDSKVLRGNPSSTISDVRTVTNAAILGINIIGFTALVEPDTLIGDELTITITSVESVGITSWVGIVTSAKLTGSYDTWWTASITMSKKPA
jgi:hypothetical protein